MTRRVETIGSGATIQDAAKRMLERAGGIVSKAQSQVLRAAADGVPGARCIEDHGFVMPPRDASGIAL